MADEVQQLEAKKKQLDAQIKAKEDPNRNMVILCIIIFIAVIAGVWYFFWR